MGNCLRKSILIVDQGREIEALLMGPFLETIRKAEIKATIVRARDGADAANKTENQKFDMVILDLDAPRLSEGGFIHSLHSYRNTQNADVIVLSPQPAEHLPATLNPCQFFQKPVSPDQLLKALVKIVNKELPVQTPACSKYAVDARVINAIIKATTSVLSQIGVANIKMEKAHQITPQDSLKGEVASVIAIKSQSFQGHLAISFDKESYLEVISKMLMEEQTEINPETLDAVGEINNMIFGNAKSEITHFGVEMTIPKVYTSPGTVIPCPEGSAGILIPFKTLKGQFYIKIIALPI